MAFNERLADRIREALAHLPDVQEKKMFHGICFMVNGKMCMSAGDTRIMCRIDPALHEAALERNGVATVKMAGQNRVGYVYVDEIGYQNPKDLKYWVDLCLDFNARAKASKKKTKKSGVVKKATAKRKK